MHSHEPEIGRTRVWLYALIPLWLAAAGGGLLVLAAYDNRPGVSADAPDRWPVATRLFRDTNGPTLLMLAHPQCSCTAASLGELAEALARTEVRPTTYVLFLRPRALGADWEQSDLWRRAAAIRGVTVVADDDGDEARRFGTETSGQTLLYDASGRLVFSGGITAARGHAGDNAGRAGLVALLARFRTPELPNSRTPELPNSRTSELPNPRTPELPNSRTSELPNPRTPELSNSRTPEPPNHTPVFGCPLSDPGTKAGLPTP